MTYTNLFHLGNDHKESERVLEYLMGSTKMFGAKVAKNYENQQRLENRGQKQTKWLFWSKMAKFRQFFAILGVKKIFDQKNIYFCFNKIDKSY